MFFNRLSGVFLRSFKSENCKERTFLFNGNLDGFCL